MAGHAYALVSASTAVTSGTTSLVERARAERRPRPFDPTRRPGQSRSVDATADPEETAARREKAQQGHHDILVCLHERLAGAGWRDVEEIPAAIDLRAINQSGASVIFEAKTISGGNQTEQARSALAQLLEYRQDYGHPDDGICVVVNAALSERRVDVLTRLGVGVAIAAGTGVQPQNEVAAAFFDG